MKFGIIFPVIDQYHYLELVPKLTVFNPVQGRKTFTGDYGEETNHFIIT